MTTDGDYSSPQGDLVFYQANLNKVVSVLLMSGKHVQGRLDWYGVRALGLTIVIYDDHEKPSYVPCMVPYHAIATIICAEEDDTKAQT